MPSSSIFLMSQSVISSGLARPRWQVSHCTCNVGLGVDSDTSRRVLMTSTILHMSRARSFSGRSEEHTSELRSLMRISYAVFCLKKKKNKKTELSQTHKQIYKYSVNNNKIT